MWEKETLGEYNYNEQSILFRLKENERTITTFNFVWPRGFGQMKALLKAGSSEIKMQEETFSMWHWN